MDKFFSATSIAIVGASSRSNSSGASIMKNILSSGFKGRLFPINRNGGECCGIECITSLSELEIPIELVIVSVKADMIYEVLLEGGLYGIKNFLILSGGFSEIGQQGLIRELKIKEIIKKFDLKIIGPNCAGFWLNLIDQKSSATFIRMAPPGGGICFISQSGALVEELVSYSRKEHLALGAVVSVGNCLTYDLSDFVEYFGNLTSCTAILIYAEGSLNIEKLISVKQNFLNKPIILLWGGKTVKGMDAAARHTSKPTKYSKKIDSYCQEHGIFIVETLRELLLTLKGLSFYSNLMGKRLVIVSNSGGPAVLSTDICEKENFELPNIPEAEGSISNPIDLLADADQNRFQYTLNMLLPYWHQVFDVLLTIQVIPAMIDADPIVDLIANFSHTSGIPILSCMMGSLEKESIWKQKLAAAGVAFFNDPEDALVLLGLLSKIGQILRLNYEFSQ